MVTVEFIKENSIFIRGGSCNRCGICCIAYDKHPQDGGIRTNCNKLSFDDDGIATCAIHGVNKYQICKDNPIYPTPCMVLPAVGICGYSWVVNDKLTKTKALEMFNKLCDLCHRKVSCVYYDKVIAEINERCI